MDARLDELEEDAGTWIAATGSVLGDMAETDGILRNHLLAMRILSGLGYGVVRPVLRDTTAIGSLMRRKLEPVVGPLGGYLKRLRGN